MFLEVCHWITVAICAILLIKATVFLEAQTTTYIWVLYKPSIFPLWILHWRCLKFNRNLKTCYKCWILHCKCSFCWMNRSVHYEIKLWIKTQNVIDMVISVKEVAFQKVKLSLCRWSSTVLMLACLLLKGLLYMVFCYQHLLWSFNNSLW